MSFRIDPRLPLEAEVRRILGQEIGKALDDLHQAGKQPDQAMHNCRKRLKKVRALLKLVRHGDSDFAKLENVRYREVSARLSGARDAAAMLETLDRLEAEFPREIADSALESIRARLASRHEQALPAGPDLQRTLDFCLDACRAGLERLDALVLTQDADAAADLLAEGAGAVMRRARKALDACRRHGDADTFHELRKAVKTHAHHLALLGRIWPGSARSRRSAAEELGDLLGNLHDVFVLSNLAVADDRPLGGLGQTRLLRKLLDRSRKRLCKRCLSAADDLFGDRLGKISRKVARQARRRRDRGAAADRPGNQ